MAHALTSTTPGSTATIPAGRRPGGLLLRRVRLPRLGSDLLRWPGRARGRPLQGGVAISGSPRRRRLVLHEGLLRPAPPTGRLAAGQRRRVRHQPHSARAGAGTEPGADRRHGGDRRPAGARARLADHGGPGAGVFARYQPRGERPRGPWAHEQALRGRPRAPAPAGVDPGRGRRAGAPSRGHQPVGVARQRGPRGVHDDRAYSRAH